MLNTAINQKQLNSRNRSVKSEIRKQQLIDATLDCIDKFGLSQTTLASIAKHAGVSQGVVVFHFQSKETLLEKALQGLSQEFGQHWQYALEQADNNPLSQLQAMVEACFAPTICNRKKISVWYAFWGESRSRPRYQKLCGQQDKLFSDTLLSICRQLEQQQTASLSAQTAALSIEGMIDGLWQNFLIGEPGFKRRQGLIALSELIEVIYPDQKCI